MKIMLLCALSVSTSIFGMNEGKRLLEKGLETSVLKKAKGSYLHTGSDAFDEVIDQGQIYDSPQESSLLDEKGKASDELKADSLFEAMASSSSVMLYNMFKELMIPCSFCKELCTSEQELEMHKRVYHEQEPINYDSSSLSLGNLEDAISNKENSGIAATNILMEQVPASMSSDKSAQQSSKVRYQCSHCKKSYASKNYCKNHELIVHIKGKDQCTVCQKQVIDIKRHICNNGASRKHGHSKAPLTSSSSLKKEEFPADYKGYFCAFCHKLCETRASLKQHECTLLAEELLKTLETQSATSAPSCEENGSNNEDQKESKVKEALGDEGFIDYSFLKDLPNDLFEDSYIDINGPTSDEKVL